LTFARRQLHCIKAVCTTACLLIGVPFCLHYYVTLQYTAKSITRLHYNCLTPFSHNSLPANW
jgi:hypothetical protein